MNLNNQYSRKELEDLICEVMDIKSITPMIRNQINKYILDYNMSFKEIARCIVWYVEVANGQFKPMYGIGIVPNIREESNAYFKKLELDRQNKAIEAKKIVEYQDNNIIFNIKSIQRKKRNPKQLDITSIDTKGENK